MTYYLGKTGALVALPDPEAGLSQSPERIGGTHQLLSGARVRDTLGRMRTWELSWTAIDLATFGALQSFYYGATGPGPYYLLDPEQRNLLPLNVSVGTDATKDTTGFTQNGAVGFSSTTNGNVNWNSLGGPFPLSGTQTLLAGIATGSGAFLQVWTVTQSIPVYPTASYTFSAYLSLDATAQTAGLQARVILDWYDASNAHISGVAGNNVTGTTGRSVASGAAPSNAATAVLFLQTATANSSGSTGFIYTDGLQFEQAGAVSGWAPGVGLPLVTVDSLTRTTPLAGICDAQMTLVQVG